MPGRSTEADSGIGGSKDGDNGLHTNNGGGCGEVPCNPSKAKGSCDRPGQCASKGGGRDVPQTAWFKPVSEEEEIMDCPGGVCPVPWLTKEETKEEVKELVDLVNHPPHYTTGGGIECIEAIEAQLTPEEFRGYLKGCVVKYFWRERYKGGVESLKKAAWYTDRLIGFDEAQNG